MSEPIAPDELARIVRDRDQVAAEKLLRRPPMPGDWATMEQKVGQLRKDRMLSQGGIRTK